MDNNIKTLPFSDVEFGKLFGTKLGRSPQATYLYRYLHDGQKSNSVDACTAMVLENVYHSVEYSAEYVAYYSGCFCGFEPFGKRVHFFGNLSPAEVDTALLGSFSGQDEEESAGALQKAYLGFVALRPIPAVQIGYTCLVPYARKDEVGDANRMFLTREKQVHLAGIRLSVRGAPFMQQDRAVAACATTALWGALQLLPHETEGVPPSTVAITEGATKYKIKTRRFPARKGLDRDQMTQAIRQCGWAPEVLDPTHDLDLARILLGAYAHSDRPAVIIARRVEPQPERGIAHALVQVGVSDRNTSEDLFEWSTDHVTIQVPAPKKIYVHDDRIGPYMRAFLEMVEDPLQLPGTEFPGLRLERDRGSDKPVIERWIILGYLVPHHPSIRLNMLDLYNTNRSVVRTLHSKVFPTSDTFRLRMDIRLKYAQDYLADIPARIRKPADEASKFYRAVTFPRFVGVVSVSLEGAPLYDLVWDTTDFCRSIPTIWDHLLAVVTYTDDYKNAFSKLFDTLLRVRQVAHPPHVL